jgi:hypothetical protein
MTIRAVPGKQEVELITADAFELEERVKERTRELEQLNIELKRQTG